MVLDVRDLITITDYFVICSGGTDRQVRSIGDEVMRQVKERGIKVVRREGEAGAKWLLLDFVDFVVHVFTRAEREYYRLEHLWRDAPVLEWESEGESEAGEASG